MAEALSSEKSHLDERRLAKAVMLGLPLVTLSAAAVTGILLGPATSILVVTAGLLLGVIALLWSSLRILSGDADLSPELEALDMAAQGVDVLASRKKMLLRALKDLENERGVGKIDDDDFDQLSAVYRGELKALLRRIDASLAPHREKAEALARTHLVKAGISATGYRGDVQAAPDSAENLDLVDPAERGDDRLRRTVDDSKPAPAAPAARARRECPKCNASNEVDAKFCKECAAKLVVEEVSDAT